jgi:hypothetical protein
MPLTFQNLQDKVLEQLDEGTTTTADTDVLSRVKEALNDADVARTISEPWSFRLVENTVTLTPGVRTYPLGATVHTMLYVWDDTNKLPLYESREAFVTSQDFVGAGLAADYGLSVYGGKGEYVLTNQSLVLLFTPTDATVINYGYLEVPVEMAANADLPNIPYPHSRVLIYDALLAIGTYNEDLTPAKVYRWEKNQAAATLAMERAYLEITGVNAVSRYIAYSGD